MNFFNFSRPRTILNNLAAPVESENPFSLQELDKPNNDAFNAPTENVNNFNLPQKKGKFPSMTGDTDYAFPTSPDLSDNEYPDITSHFLDKKFSLYDGIAQRRASRDVADIRHYLSQGFDQGQEFDLTHDPKFPGIAEDGSPQYAMLGGTKVNGSMLTHHLMGLGLGASGTDYAKFKLPNTITHPEAMISGLLAHQKGYEHEANSPLTAINRMQQAAERTQLKAIRKPELIATNPQDIGDPNSPRYDFPLYQDLNGEQIASNPLSDIPDALSKIKNNVGKSLSNIELDWKEQAQPFLDIGQAVVDPKKRAEIVEKPKFDKALNEVYGEEGGYSNDSRDQGGVTMKGVSQVWYNKYTDQNHLPRRNVAELTETERRKFYHDEFWNRVDASNKPSYWRGALFDTAVNIGPGYANEWYQKSNGDIDKFFNLRKAHHYAESKKPKQAVFLEGWLDRNERMRGKVKHLKNTNYKD